MKICRFVAEELKLPFVHDAASAAAVKGRFDVVFLRPGVLLFSPHRERIFELLKGAQVVVNLEIDYAWPPDSRIRKLSRKLVQWGTIQGQMDQYVNFNMVPFIEPDQARPPYLVRRPGLFYWGKFREGRAVYLSKWLEGGHGYSVTVATYKASTYRMPHSGIEFIRLRDVSAINDYRLTMYMEDEEQHDSFHSLAQRFYECLLHRVPLVIEPHARHTFDRAGMEHASDFVVHSYGGIKRALSQWEELLKRQQQLWGQKNYAGHLRAQLRRAVARQFGAKTKFKEIS